MSSFHEAHGGLRFVDLVNQLGLSRDSLRSSLVSLLELGLIQKNPGYGHPLRPEYILCDRGIDTAGASHQFLQITRERELYLRKWPAPLLLSLEQGYHRFNALRDALEISPRALTQALRQLESEGVVKRSVDVGYPPTTSYHLSKTGLTISQQINHLNKQLQPGH